MQKSRKRDPGYVPRLHNGVWKGWGWFVVPQWDLTICASPKCGSSSFKHYFFENKMDDVRMVNQHKVDPNSNIYFVVRDPRDRFVSLWKSKCRDRTKIIDTDVYGLSPRALAAHISSGKRDVHWERQVDLIGDAIPDDIIPLPYLTEWWREQGFGELGNFNVTEGDVQLDEDVEHWIKRRYAADYALYDKALSMHPL